MPPKLFNTAYEKKNEEVTALIDGYIKERELRAKGQNELPKREVEENPRVGKKKARKEKQWCQIWKAGNESRVNDCCTSVLGSTAILMDEHGEKKYRQHKKLHKYFKAYIHSLAQC